MVHVLQCPAVLFAQVLYFSALGGLCSEIFPRLDRWTDGGYFEPFFTRGIATPFGKWQAKWKRSCATVQTMVARLQSGVLIISIHVLFVGTPLMPLLV